MTAKDKRNLLLCFSLIITGLLIIPFISSCGKQSISSPTGLNVKYEVINLSPDVLPVNLYIKFLKVNTTPYYYAVPQGYFYVTALDTPYLIRSAAVNGGAAILSRGDILKSGATYSLFITGELTNNTLQTIFTVDTAIAPKTGRGKVRFLNASPTGATGYDVYANGTIAFKNIKYPNFTDYIEVPNGVYDFQVMPTGGTTVLRDLPNITIQDGRLYTFYSFGYTTRADTAGINSAIITNR